MLRKKKKTQESEDVVIDPTFQFNIKLIASVLATALISAGGGSLITSQSSATGAANAAANVCDGVVADFLTKMENAQKACDERIKMCYQNRRGK